MALTATAQIGSSTPPLTNQDRPARSAARRHSRWPASAVVALALVLAGGATPAAAGDAAVGPAIDTPEERSVTIVLRAPVTIVDGDRVTLQSMLRFSGRAWEDARIEILANGVVVSETFALRGGVWYAPRARIPAGDYEFAARAIMPDGTPEVSDVLRVTVSPPVLLDPESLAGKSVYSVGSLRPAASPAAAAG